MATTFAPIGTDYTIVLDASFDLYAAGDANGEDEQAEFTEAYREAAKRIAEKQGIKITVVPGNYDGPAMQEQTKNGDEGELWQSIHDNTSYEA